jgi:hypothetical protein
VQLSISLKFSIIITKIIFISLKIEIDDSELKIINNSNVDFHTNLSTFYYEQNKCIKLKNPLQYRRQQQQQQ